METMNHRSSRNSLSIAYRVVDDWLLNCEQSKIPVPSLGKLQDLILVEGIKQALERVGDEKLEAAARLADEEDCEKVARLIRVMKTRDE